MPTSERMLRKWRKEALSRLTTYSCIKREDTVDSSYDLTVELSKSMERILQLTQELLDQHLLKK